MGKVQFQVDGLDSNTASIFNADATFDGNVDANSISIGGTDLFNLLPSGTTYANTEPSNPIIGQVWIDSDSSVTSLTQNDLEPYALISSPSFTGNVTLPTNTSIGNVSATELGYLDGVTSAIQTQLNTKAPTSNPTFSGTVIADAISTSGSGISGSLFTNITTGTAIIGTGLTSGGVSIAPGSSFNGTVAIATGSISSGTRTINIGTGQATGATTNINLGSSNGTSVVSINSGLETRKTIRTGTNSFAKTLSNGDIALDNGTTDTPGIMFYDANNTNFGIDVSTGLRFVRNLNEAGGSVMGSFDTSGNLNIGASLGVGSNLNVTGTINGATINNDAWTSFTPALSTENGAWTIGNGSIDAAYKLIGKTCHFRAKIVWGSTTSTSTGALLIGLPLTAANTSYQFPVSILDNGLAWYQATGNGMYINHTSKFAMIFKSSTGTSSEGLTGTSPFTFGSGDYISLSGTYEVA